MRAIPSPHERTRPVSRTEMLPSKPLISFLRISLISDGRISAIGLFVTRSARYRLACEPAFGLCEASCKAAVVDFSAQLRSHTAEQRGVDFHGWDNFQFCEGLESADHARYLGVGRLNRKGQGRALTAHLLIEQLAIRLGNRANLADAPVARYPHRERATREAELEALANLRHRLLPRLIGQLGRREAIDKLRRLDHRGQPFELGAPLLLVALVGQIEQGARVALGDS